MFFGVFMKIECSLKIQLLDVPISIAIFLYLIKNERQFFYPVSIVLNNIANK